MFFLVLVPRHDWYGVLSALTRRKERVVVLHQGSALMREVLSRRGFPRPPHILQSVWSSRPSVIGGRFSNSMIHITSRGDAVRSKSEVIIANLFHAKGVHYLYEEPLIVDGVTKYPDFTIEDDDTGITYYWEHCGMLSDPAYNRRWEEKKVGIGRTAFFRKSERRSKGTLIVSLDSGGISSQDVTSLNDSVVPKLDAVGC